MEEKSLAMELLKDYKKANKRQFIVILVILSMWFITIGYLVYILNNISSVETTAQEVSDIETIGGSVVNNGDVNNGFMNLSTQVSNGFSDNATNICNLRSDVLTGNMGVVNAIQDSKYSDLINAKDTQRDILLQTTQLENQAGMNALTMQGKLDECCCSLKAQGIENTQKIIDVLTTNTIDDLRSQVNDLKNTITGASIVNQVRPFPIPAYPVSSPYVGLYNGYGFNNGFYGNTIY